MLTGWCRPGGPLREPTVNKREYVDGGECSEGRIKTIFM